MEKKESSSEKVGNKSTSVLCNTSPDYESKEIKNIYIDCKLLIFSLFLFHIHYYEPKEVTNIHIDCKLLTFFPLI